MYIGGYIQAAHIPSSRIPNIYDPEGPIPNPNPEDPAACWGDDEQLFGLFPSRSQKKSAGPALISYIYEYLYVYISIYMYICMTQGPIPKDRTPNPEPRSIKPLPALLILPLRVQVLPVRYQSRNK